MAIPTPVPPPGYEEHVQKGTCLYAGPGRGDCYHFVGLPKDKSNFDAWGLPNGWCQHCWMYYRIAWTLDLLYDGMKDHTGDASMPSGRERQLKDTIARAFNRLSGMEYRGLEPHKST